MNRRASSADLQRHAALGEAVAQVVEHQVDDPLDLGLRQRLEQHDVVDPVEELGPEVRPQLAPGPPSRASGLISPSGVTPSSRYVRADVGGHDHDRVAEVDRTALRVGEPAVVEHLQQRVEHVGVGLLDLVEQHHRVRLAAHRLGELAALLVADVARAARRPGG